MGQCYAIDCKLIYEDRNKLIETIRDSMENYPCNWNCNLKTIDNIEDFLSLMFYTGNVTIENNSIEYKSFFDQSYQWEIVMIEIFEKWAEVLEDNSHLIVYPDRGSTEIRIEGHKAITL